MKTFNALVSIAYDHYPKPILEASGTRDTIRIPAFNSGIYPMVGLTATRFGDHWVIVRDDAITTTIPDSDTTAREIWEFGFGQNPL